MEERAKSTAMMPSIYQYCEKRRLVLPTAMILAVFSEKRRMVLPTAMIFSVFREKR